MTSAISSLYPIFWTCDTVPAFIPRAASRSSLILKASFFLRLIRAVVTKIRLAHPSKEPSPLKSFSLLNSVMNPSWRMSSARTLSPMYLMHIGNIRGARRSYRTFWDARSPCMHDSISFKSKSSATFKSQVRVLSLLLMRPKRCNWTILCCILRIFFTKFCIFPEFECYFCTF